MNVRKLILFLGIGSNWILRDGTWNDSRIWIDEANWID